MTATLKAIRKSQKAEQLQNFVNAIREWKGLDPLYDRSKLETAPPHIYSADPTTGSFASGCRWIRGNAG